MREITPLSERDCFYIADRRKTEFTYPIHCHAEYELNFTEHASGVRRVVGDSAEVIGDYDLVLITGKELEHVWEQHVCGSNMNVLQGISEKLQFSFLQIFSLKTLLIKISLIVFAGCWKKHNVVLVFQCRLL